MAKTCQPTSFVFWGGGGGSPNTWKLLKASHREKTSEKALRQTPASTCKYLQVVAGVCRSTFSGLGNLLRCWMQVSVTQDLSCHTHQVHTKILFRKYLAAVSRVLICLPPTIICWPFSHDTAQLRLTLYLPLSLSLFLSLSLSLSPLQVLGSAVVNAY